MELTFSVKLYCVEIIIIVDMLTEKPKVRFLQTTYSMFTAHSWLYVYSTQLAVRLQHTVGCTFTAHSWLYVYSTQLAVCLQHTVGCME